MSAPVLARRPSASDRVRAFLREHPSLRRALASGLLNDAALARRIRQEFAERLSFEAVAVALRRAEQSGLDVDPHGVAARLLAGGSTLELRTQYTVLRFPDSEEALEGYVAGRAEQGRRPGRTILHVEEGHPYITVACPTAQAPEIVGSLPPGVRTERTDGFALVLLAAEAPASNTPGVIAFFAERLAERGVTPRLMAAARSEVGIVAPEGEARVVFSFLHDLRRAEAGERGRPPPRDAKGSSPIRLARAGAGTTARRREHDPRNGAEIARDYVAVHPSVEDCLVYGVVNVTALARRIAEEARYDRPEAVEAALRRWRPAHPNPTTVEQRILAVVRASRLEVRTRVALVTAPPTWELLGRLLQRRPNPIVERRRLFQVLQGPASVTVLCDEDLVDPVLRAFGDRRSIQASRNLSAVVVHSPESILETPGVLAYLSGAIYRAGLNCLELMSLHLESTFVVRQADVLATFGVLSDLVHPGPGGNAGAGAGAAAAG